MGDYIYPPGDEAPPVGVRDLKAHAARIVKHVREAQASYVVTHRGQAVGVILPLDPKAPSAPTATDAGSDDAWAAFLRAGRKLEARFARKSGVRILSESRR